MQKAGTRLNAKGGRPADFRAGLLLQWSLLLILSLCPWRCFTWHEKKAPGAVRVDQRAKPVGELAEGQVLGRGGLEHGARDAGTRFFFEGRKARHLWARPWFLVLAVFWSLAAPFFARSGASNFVGGTGGPSATTPINKIQASSMGVISGDFLLQRANVAGKVANMKQGARTDLQPSANLPEVSQAEAAKLLNVSERLVRDAVHVQHKAAPEVVQAIEGYLR